MPHPLRRRLCFALAVGAWGACAGAPASTDKPSSPDDDTDPVRDTDLPADTDPPADDTDLPDDTADTDPAPPPAPVLLGRGFVDLTTALYASHPRFARPVDLATRTPPMQTGGMFVDLDGDGRDEVVLTGTSPLGAADPAAAWALRYDPATESLAPDDALTEALRSTAPLLGALCDVDGDGIPDGVGGADPYVGVRFGLGGAAWGDPIPSSEFMVGDNGVVVALADLDRDGWLDLLHGPGGGPAVESFVARYQTAPRVFESRPDRVAGNDDVQPFVVGASPLAGRDPMLMAFGGPTDRAVDGPTFFSQTSTDAEGFPLYTALDPTPPDSLYKQEPGVAGRSVSWQRPMGAVVSDLDADGRPDLVITTTASYLLLFRDDGTPLLRDKSIAWDASLPPRMPVDTGLPAWQQVMRPWAVAAVDVDRDGRNDLVVANGDDPSESFLANGTGYRPTLYVRRGSAFVESGVAAGLALPTSGQALTTGDLDGDGRVDLLLGGFGEVPRVYLNRVDATPAGLAVRLAGTSSNPLGIGAWLQGTDGGVPFDASVMGGVVARGPMPEPVVFLAAGADGVLDQLMIRWPSGFDQLVNGLAAGQVHTISEPVTVTVDDVDRHAPADGTSTISVSMTPRAPDGTVRAGVVGFRVAGGTGTWVGSPTTLGGTTTAVLRAPSAPGWAIVEVTVDGVPLPLRPHLWWDAAR